MNIHLTQTAAVLRLLPTQGLRKLLAVALLSAPVYAKAPATCADNPLARTQAALQLQTLNAEILSSRSATLVLERWCHDHKLAAPPTIVARRLQGMVKSPSAEQLQRLGVTRANQVKYRRVELRCGERILSKADNWYVPSRLSPEMNQLLETTDTPFGKVVASLQPFRQTIEAKVLWSPLPRDMDCVPRPSNEKSSALVIPPEIFQHRALLFTGNHLPFSEVREVYQGGALALPEAQCVPLEQSGQHNAGSDNQDRLPTPQPEP